MPVGKKIDLALPAITTWEVCYVFGTFLLCGHSRVVVVSKLVKRWMLWHLGDPSDMVLSCTNQIDQCFSSDLIAAFSVL